MSNANIFLPRENVNLAICGEHQGKTVLYNGIGRAYQESYRKTKHEFTRETGCSVVIDPEGNFKSRGLAYHCKDLNGFEESYGVKVNEGDFIVVSNYYYNPIIKKARATINIYKILGFDPTNPMTHLKTRMVNHAEAEGEKFAKDTIDLYATLTPVKTRLVTAPGLHEDPIYNITVPVTEMVELKWDRPVELRFAQAVKRVQNVAFPGTSWQ